MNFEKKTAIININSSQNNTIFLVKDLNGKELLRSSLGLALKKNRGKKSLASGAQKSSEIIIENLERLNIKKIIIKVKGFGRGRESALFTLASSSLIIEEVLDVSPIVHNGTRPKKKRRL